MSGAQRHLVLISDAAQTCGIEEFARQTALHLGSAGTTLVLAADGFRQALASHDDLVINLPVVAWKKRLLSPIAAAAEARLAGRDVTVILHEWDDLAPARRTSYVPLLPLATRLLFSAPEVMAQFARSPLARVVTRQRGVVPIPPNFRVPAETSRGPLAERLAAERVGGRLIIGQFGSIYPKKDPFALLEAGAELKRGGVAAHLVFIGSFIKDSGNLESEFWSRVETLGLKGQVTVSGFVADDAELFGLFEMVDVFAYPLAEGLTSRRASVLAAALSGRPVLVTAPERADSLAHHGLFRALLDAGAITLSARGATPKDVAGDLLRLRLRPTQKFDANKRVESLWADLVHTLDHPTQPHPTFQAETADA